MREIKFRAWDKTAKQMYQVDELGIGKYDWQQYAKGDKQPKTGKNKFYPSQVEINQNTGLRDKNGVEIYEGDIVMFDYEWTKPTEIGVITWNKDNASFQIKGHIPSFSMKHLNQMKVVGNIYENNELLRKEGK